jgi:hypothetical protein
MFAKRCSANASSEALCSTFPNPHQTGKAWIMDRLRDGIDQDLIFY